MALVNHKVAARSKSCHGKEMEDSALRWDSSSSPLALELLLLFIHTVFTLARV
jgi:hypothetical protein